MNELVKLRVAQANGMNASAHCPAVEVARTRCFTVARSGEARTRCFTGTRSGEAQVMR